MTPSEYLPGMRPHRRARNTAISLVYLVSLPISLPLTGMYVLVFTGYVFLTAGGNAPPFSGQRGGSVGMGTTLHPAIGWSVLLVLTAVAAALIGTFAVGFAAVPMDVPQSGFSFERAGPGTVAVTHVAGDSLDPATLTVRVDEATTTGSWNPVPVRAGSTYLVTGIEGGETIRVVYTDSSGTSQTLATYEAGA